MRPRPHDIAAVDVGFGAALPYLGTVQRASLGRGLAFLLILAVACLVLVYGPPARGVGDPWRPGPTVTPLSATMPRLPVVAAVPELLSR